MYHGFKAVLIRVRCTCSLLQASESVAEVLDVTSTAVYSMCLTKSWSALQSRIYLA
jgi:hypothetical protein